MFFNCIITIVILVILVKLFLKWYTANFDYFEKKGIKHKIPKLSDFSVFKFIKLDVNEEFQKQYDEFEGEEMFGGFQFRTPVYFLRGTKAVKKIAVKDFGNFIDRVEFSDISSEKLISSMLSVMKGKQWRDMRATLSPAFTGSKMRLMFQFVRTAAQQMVEYFEDESRKNPSEPQVFDMKEVFTKYSNDVIISCAFGIEINTFKDANNDLYKMGKIFLDIQKPLSILKFFIIRSFPNVAKSLRIKIFDEKTQDKFYKVILDNMKTREEHGIRRLDMINMLMELRKGNSIEDKNEVNPPECDNSGVEKKRIWTDDDLVAQCFQFFLAGFETTSSSLVFIAYELATNPDVQTKLQEEIDKMNRILEEEKRELNYEDMQNGLKYLDMVVSESLRKWPAAFLINRLCVKDYTYEDEKGNSFEIEAGKMIFIFIRAFHMNEKYFPEPEKFIPERFENKLEHADYYMPFGLGPRNCIGIRFALMELKAALYYILLKCSFKVAKSTQVPIKLKKKLPGLFPEEKVKLIVELRHK